MPAIEEITFNEDGLVPAIAQDAENGEVLMMAWMNRQSLELTLSTGIMHYWSRSRGELWRKGATSGHEQTVRELRYDCDGDTILARVRQKGAACHTGKRSCFFNVLADKS
jgi:phosphoribosyl-AMP cyclohydrolase